MSTEPKELKREAPAPSGMERTRNRKVFIPFVDIYETKDEIVLLADMPGVDEKGVDITLEKDVLSLTGTVSEDRYPGYSIGYSEYETGDFRRAFTLSDEVDRERIEASMKNGVLRVRLRKIEPAKAKKIPIRSE
ncbi:MAG: Spore protein SP21 [Syntrophaceae bacterium PtaU1.Bin231]|nr:MAG: Spore protein SP21 [Syntrophaceae bacterium PtaU1.Bin231]